MPPTLTENDLYEDIGRDELEGLSRSVLVTMLGPERDATVVGGVFTYTGTAIPDGRVITFTDVGTVAELNTTDMFYVVTPTPTTFRVATSSDVDPLELTDGAVVFQLGQRSPVEKELDDSLALVSMYVDPFLIKDDVFRRIMRLLAISGLYNRLATIPKKRQDERTWCLKTLQDIRDGKFPNLLYNTELPPEDGGGSGVMFGGACRKFTGGLQ